MYIYGRHWPLVDN